MPFDWPGDLIGSDVVLADGDLLLEDVLFRWREDGFVAFKNRVQVQCIQDCAEVWWKLNGCEIQKLVDGKVQGNRSTHRLYIDHRLMPPFIELLRKLLEIPEVRSILRDELGPDYSLYQFASDTPVQHSEYQQVHADGGKPEVTGYPKIFKSADIISLNVPLVDVSPDRGPLEIIAGSRYVPEESIKRFLQSGSKKLQRVVMGVGDLVIRDPKTLHRGTPNRSLTPRPMLVFSFAKKGHERRKRIPELELGGIELSTFECQILRLALERKNENRKRKAIDSSMEQRSKQALQFRASRTEEYSLSQEYISHAFFLSCRKSGLVDAFTADDGSGRQRWVFQSIDGTSQWYVKVSKGVPSVEQTFLSFQDFKPTLKKREDADKWFVESSNRGWTLRRVGGGFLAQSGPIRNAQLGMKIRDVVLLPEAYIWIIRLAEECL